MLWLLQKYSNMVVYKNSFYMIDSKIVIVFLSLYIILWERQQK